MGERMGQQPFFRLKLMELRPRSRPAVCEGGASLRRAGRPEPVSVTRQRYHTPRTAGRRLASSKARAKSLASPRSDGRLFLLELWRVAATDRRTLRGPWLWRIPRAQLSENRGQWKQQRS